MLWDLGLWYNAIYSSTIDNCVPEIILMCEKVRRTKFTFKLNSELNMYFIKI